MKGTFNFIVACLMYFSVAISAVVAISCTESVATTQPKQLAINAKAIKKVKDVSVLAKEITAIEANQFGVCDTCVTGFKAVIIENRLLANELAQQNIKMREALDSNLVELNKLRELVSKNRQKRQDYELKYALASSQ